MSSSSIQGGFQVAARSLTKFRTFASPCCSRGARRLGALVRQGGRGAAAQDWVRADPYPSRALPAECARLPAGCAFSLARIVLACAHLATCPLPRSRPGTSLWWARTTRRCGTVSERSTQVSCSTCPLCACGSGAGRVAHCGGGTAGVRCVASQACASAQLCSALRPLHPAPQPCEL